MRERIHRWLTGRRGSRRPTLILVGVVVGFTVVLATQLRPPDPESRLPASDRLAALIDRQQRENEAEKAQVAALHRQVSDQGQASSSEKAGSAAESAKMSEEGLLAGTVAMSGVGFTVTLDDSSLSTAPTGNVNDLVIHSQDVQAVVNAMWGSGAEAIAINGQRAAATSAILCVGNTLLINGTVHAPPYEIATIGANRSQFGDDPLVRRLRQDADRFSLRFSIDTDKQIAVPAYNGPTAPKYAQPNG